MNVTVIGAGYIGGILGKKWAEAGHDVAFGVRNPADPRYADLSASARMLPVGEALARAEAVLLAIPGAAVEEFAAQYGSLLAGKLVFDATNRPGAVVLHNLEALQRHAPAAHFVRAFSTLGGECFSNPQLGGVQIDLFFCGHGPSRSIAEKLIADIGLRPVYLGDLQAVELVDGLTRLWFGLAYGQGKGRRIAFKLLEEASLS
jgi:hypothetical protein